MPKTAAQIVTQACLDAKTPGMLSIAGGKLNDILQELCMTYDFAVARQTTTLTFNVGANGTNTGSGPYLLPANYLRSQNGKQFYLVNGTPYWMTSVDEWEYDAGVQIAGFQDFPKQFFVDMSPTAAVGGQPQEFFWPPPSLSAVVTIRYFALMPDIATPETSNTVPWFPYQKYLITRLTGEMFQTADDERAAAFLTDKEEINPQGAGVLLRRYLNLKDDPEGRVKTVALDERRFARTRWSALPNTKNIGW